MSGRHAEHVLLRDLRSFCEKPDARPALICHDVADLRVEGLELDRDFTADWPIELRDVREAVFHSADPPHGTKTWVRVSGARSKNILLLPDALRDVQKPFELAEGMAPGAVSLRPIFQ